jgi:hypothetical protein
LTPALQTAAQVSRVLGHLTIVGLGGGALPVNFLSPRNECPNRKAPVLTEDLRVMLRAVPQNLL